MPTLMYTQGCSSAYVAGIFSGCALALLCYALLSYCVSSSGNVKLNTHATPAPVLSRRERAEKLLEGMCRQKNATPNGENGFSERKGTENAAYVRSAGKTDAEGKESDVNAGQRQGCSGDSSSSWASTSENEEEDSEYERMKDLRLKMVFVVRHPVQPKMSAQEIAVLIATAGVQLAEMHQRNERDNQQSATPNKKERGCMFSPSPSTDFTPNAEDQRRWLHWYLWWNRVGCAKITLKCSERVTMDAVARGAAEMRLPIVRLHRSHFDNGGGVTTQKVAQHDADEVVVIAMGPSPSDVLEPVTGALKLFS